MQHVIYTDQTRVTVIADFRYLYMTNCKMPSMLSCLFNTFLVSHLGNWFLSSFAAKAIWIGEVFQMQYKIDRSSAPSQGLSLCPVLGSH